MREREQEMERPLRERESYREGEMMPERMRAKKEGEALTKRDSEKEKIRSVRCLSEKCPSNSRNSRCIIPCFS